MVSRYHIERFAKWLFYLLMFFLPYQIDFESFYLFDLWITPLIGIFFALLFCLVIEILSFQQIRKIPFIPLFFIYGVVASLSYVAGNEFNNFVQSIWVVFRLAWMPILIYLLAFRYLDYFASQRALKILCISASLSSVLAIIQALSGGQLFGGFLTNQRYLGLFQQMPDWVIAGRVDNLFLLPAGIYRGHGGFHSSNLFGAFLSMTMSITWAFYRRSKKDRGFWIVLFIVQFFGVMATFSRSAWAALLIGLGSAWVIEALFIKKGRLENRIFIILLIFILFGVAFGAMLSFSQEFRERFISLFDPLSVPELNWRIMVWETALKQIIQNPWLGSGQYEAISIPDRLGRDVSYGAHNLLIQVAYEQGFISMIILVYLIFLGLLVQARKTFVNKVDRDMRYFTLGLFCAFLSFIVAGVGSSLMSYENLSFLFFALLAISFKLHGKNFAS